MIRSRLHAIFVPALHHSFLPLTLWFYLRAANSNNTGSYRLRLAALFLASTIFYAWWDPRFVPLLLGTVAFNWLLVKWHFRTGEKRLLVLGVVANLAVLGVFKYANFFAENVLNFVGITHQPWSISCRWASVFYFPTDFLP